MLNEKNILIICDLSHSSPRVPGYVKILEEKNHKIWIISPKISRRKRKFLKENLKSSILYCNSYSPREKKGLLVLSVRVWNRFIPNRRLGVLNDKLVSNLSRRNQNQVEFLAKKTINDFKIEILISTSSPFYCHELASKIKAIYKVKWLADYRDLWSQNHVLLKNDKLQIKYESSVIQSADGVITVANFLKVQLVELYKGPIYLLRNGFGDLVPEVSGTLANTVKIGYFGQIYFGYHDVLFFIDNLESLNVNSKNRKHYVLNFYGESSKQILQFYKAQKKKVPNFIKLNRPIKSEDLIKVQNSNDFLLIFNWMDNNFNGALPTKLYDYMSSKKPILASGLRSEDECSRILKETGLGIQLRTASDFIEWNSVIQSNDIFPSNHNMESIRSFRFLSQLDKLLLEIGCDLK